MVRRIALVLAGIVAVVVLLIGGGLAAVRLTDLEGALRGPIERRLEALTGRPVEIAGAFELVPALAPTVAAEQVAVANAPWGSEPAMLQADRIELTLQLLPLLTGGDVLVDRLSLVGADVLIETGETGLNWAVGDGATAGSPERRLLFSELSIDDGRVRWSSPDGGGTVQLDRAAWVADDATEALQISAEGSAWERPFSLAGSAGPLADVIDGGDPYPIALAGTFGAIELRADGTVVPSSGVGELNVLLTGKHIAALSDLVGTALPELGPYRVEARLVSGTGRKFAAPEIDLMLGAPEWAVLEATGAIARLDPPSGIDGRFTVEGEGLAALGSRLGLDLPAIGPYRLEGVVTGSADALALADLTGTVDMAEAGMLRLEDGRVAELLSGSDILLPLAAEGERIEPLLALVGLDVGPFGPYEAATTVTGSLGALAFEDLDVSAGTDPATVNVAGSVAQPFTDADLALDVTASGTTFAALSPLVGLDLPSAGPFDLAGRVSGAVRDLHLQDVRMALAGSRLSGTVAVALPAGGVPRIGGTVEAGLLDLDQLTAMLGDGRTEADGADDGPMTLPLDMLDDLRADLTVAAESVVLDGMEVGSARADIHLADGTLAIQDFTMRAAGGIVAGAATLAREPTPGEAPPTADVALRLHAEELDVADLLSEAGLPEKAVGTIEIDLAIDSRGRTLDALLGELEGDATVVSEEARILDTQLNRLVPDLDLLQLLPIFWRRADSIRVNCLVGEFDAENGLIATEALLDTRRMTLLGQGTVDLDADTLDLALEPVPKGGKLSRTGVPIDVEGPLGSPRIRPRAEETVGRLLRGALGGLLVPLNQIAGLFGQETANACADAVGRARGGAAEQQ